MNTLRRLWGTLTRRDQLSADVRDEMDFHIAERTRDLIRRGVDPAEAARQAQMTFGNTALLGDQARDADVVQWLDATVREAGQGLRGLLRRPGLVVTAVLSLALGIGGTSAIFSVVDAVLLKPVSVPESERVVVLREKKKDESIGGNVQRLKDYRAQARSFSELAGYYGERATTSGANGPERYRITRTFGPFLSLLRAQPQQGRLFSAEEENGIGAPVALIGYNSWLRRFAGDPQILGRSIAFEETSYTIVGVLPQSFGFPLNTEFVIPAGAGLQNAGRKGNYFDIIGRLKPGMSLEAATAEVDGIARGLGITYPDDDRDLTANVISLQTAETGEARGPLLLLLGAVGVVLIVCCVNIASLLLARAAERSHEAAIRVSLGAGRASLIRLYMIESGWLALGGGLLGLILAATGVPLLKHFLPPELPRLEEAALDWRVALFTLGVAVACGLFFGLAPAWQAARSSGIALSLREGGRNTAGGKRLFIRRSLVVLQVSLSMLLLVAAGLLAESLYRKRVTPTGIDSRQLLAVRVNLSWDTGEKRLHRVYRDALRELAVMPGVTAVGLTDRLPLEGESQRRPLRLEREDAPGSESLKDKSISFRLVSDGYFATVGVPMQSGRIWRETIDSIRPHELVVNQAFARRYLPADRPAEGTRLTFDVAPKAGTVPEWYEIVGVVGDMRQTLEQTEQPPEVFLPFAESYWPLATFVLRTQGDPASLAPAVRAVFARVVPDQVVDRIAPVDLELADLSRASETRTWLVGVFAGMAVLLAAIGLFGVLSSDVAQRRQEIGVRLALGAEAGQVRWMMIRDGLLVSVLGLLIGSAAALAFGQVLASALYGVTPRDVSAFVGAAGVLFVVAFVASWLPARRAAAVDPSSALRGG